MMLVHQLTTYFFLMHNSVEARHFLLVLQLSPWCFLFQLSRSLYYHWVSRSVIEFLFAFFQLVHLDMGPIFKLKPLVNLVLLYHVSIVTSRYKESTLSLVRGGLYQYLAPFSRRSIGFRFRFSNFKVKVRSFQMWIAIW